MYADAVELHTANKATPPKTRQMHRYLKSKNHKIFCDGAHPPPHILLPVTPVGRGACGSAAPRPCPSLPLEKSRSRPMPHK